MRVKKQKRHRRAVRFYTACFGFRQPYKVLCDGTFIHHLIVNNIAPADTAISNILGGSVKLFTTRSAPFCFSFSLCSKIRRKIGFLFVCCCFVVVGVFWQSWKDLGNLTLNLFRQLIRLWLQGGFLWCKKALSFGGLLLNLTGLWISEIGF